MWFNSNDLIYNKPIILDDLHGYILPHAGTTHTKNIVNHTLQFKPSKTFHFVKIIYYPSSDNPNIDGIWYHEYYVIWKIMEHYIKNFWKLKNIKFIPVNLRENHKINIKNTAKHNRTNRNKLENNRTKKSGGSKIPTNANTIFVVSADFSHGLPLKTAIREENCAAKTILHRINNLDCTNVIDDIISFNYLYKNIPNNWMLQWIGRTRSIGSKGVGYLSFLIRNKPIPSKKPPDGLFITVYDKNMVAHECLGKWFKFKTWRKTIENEFANEVIQKASQSRLTSGQLRNQPMTNYTITYLYVSKSQQFKRGWHGVRNNAFYLPEVFLENTYENGKWIKKLDTEWQAYDTFNFDETNEKLASKSNVEITKQPVFYDTAVIHKKY